MSNLKIRELADDGILRKLSNQETENIIGGNNVEVVPLEQIIHELKNDDEMIHTNTIKLVPSNEYIEFMQSSF